MRPPLLSLIQAKPVSDPFLTCMKLNMRIEFRYLSLAVLVFLLEVLVATSFSAVRFIRGSISDFLVVILLYFLLAGCVRISAKKLALGIFVFAALVELAQYLHLADKLGLAKGGLLRMLLGEVFSWQDILMYALGSLCAWALHHYGLPEQASETKSKPRVD